MVNRLPRSGKSHIWVLGAATLTLLWLPGATQAQTQPTAAQGSQPMATQDRPALGDQDRPGVPNDDITRRDVAQFDQFLDGHREVAEQLRRTPSLIDDPQFLQNHPELNAYLEEHASVKQEVTARPDAFMRMEDLYDANDRNLRDHDAGGAGRDGFRADANGGGDDARAEIANFDQFLDGHREIAEQVRRDPSLCDNRDFVRDHPALDSYLRDNPGVRDQLRQDPNAFLRQADLYARNGGMGDRAMDGQGRDDFRADAANFNRFLDGHREIAEQVRRDPSLCDNRDFVQNHPALQAYFQDNPGLRDRLRQDPRAFMQQDSNWDQRDRDPMHDRMADFGGFLGNHSDIQKDLSRDPSAVKDPAYLQQHSELNAYLSAHPDVRSGLMADPQGFVQGAQQYSNGSATGSSGWSGNGRGMGTTGSVSGTSTTTTGTATTGTTGTAAGTSTSSSTTNHPKPNQ